VNRKIAWGIIKKYSSHIDQFHLPEEGLIEFAQWENPLARTIDIRHEHVNFYKNSSSLEILSLILGLILGTPQYLWPKLPEIRE